MDLGIVIPCYNEFKRITQSIFENFLNQKQEISFCFVNDGSTDNTITILMKLRKINPKRIHVIDLKNNEGKANAVKEGMIFFLKKKNLIK